jgi:hypothetical protein
VASQPRTKFVIYFGSCYKIKKIIPNRLIAKTSTVSRIRVMAVLLRPIDSKLTKLYAAIPTIETISQARTGFDSLIVLRSKF